MYFPGILYEFQRYFLEKPYQCLVFQMFLDFDCQFLHVRKVLYYFSCAAKRLLLLKMPFPTFRKLCCSYCTEKRKIRSKKLVGRKCSAVIIMSLFYPIETLGNGTKNRQQSDYTRLTDNIYPISWCKKQMKFLAIYS